MVFRDAILNHQAWNLCWSRAYEKTLLNLTMWWAVIGAAVWVGGTVFMFSLINPQWSQEPPVSVRQLFLQTFTSY